MIECTHIGYLFTGGTTAARPGMVEVASGIALTSAMTVRLARSVACGFWGDGDAQVWRGADAIVTVPAMAPDGGGAQAQFGFTTSVP
jgi:hypothetical protein